MLMKLDRIIDGDGLVGGGGEQHGSGLGVDFESKHL